MVRSWCEVIGLIKPKLEVDAKSKNPHGRGIRETGKRENDTWLLHPQQLSYAVYD
jgi:hypothetical protein